MKRMIETTEKTILRIWSVMLKESKDFYAFNSVVIRPRGVDTEMREFEAFMGGNNE